jgi:hypothetical protein
MYWWNLFGVEQEEWLVEELWNEIYGSVNLDTIKAFRQDCSQVTNRTALKENAVYLLSPLVEEECTLLHITLVPVRRH